MPDFIKGKHNPARYEIMYQLIAKRKALSNRDYLLCNNCLPQDFDGEHNAGYVSGDVEKVKR